MQVFFLLSFSSYFCYEHSRILNKLLLYRSSWPISCSKENHILIYDSISLFVIDCFTFYFVVKHKDWTGPCGVSYSRRSTCDSFEIWSLVLQIFKSKLRPLVTIFLTVQILFSYFCRGSPLTQSCDVWLKKPRGLVSIKGVGILRCLVLFVWLDSLHPSQQFFRYSWDRSCWIKPVLSSG